MGKVLSNNRRTIWAATVGSNPFADEKAPTDAEINAMLKVAPVIKWDSTDLGLQESTQIDDRVITDEGSAQRAGNAQFGGTINLLTPKDENNSADRAVQAAALFATENLREELWIVDRLVPLSSATASAGNTINLYKVMTDAKKNQTEGETSYSYTVTLIPRGTVIPQYVVADDTTAGDITLTGHSAALAVGDRSWGKATYEGNDITNLATYTSSDPDVMVVEGSGIIRGVSAGTASLVPLYPGAAVHAGLPITVS